MRDLGWSIGADVGEWADEAACRGASPDLFFPPRGAPSTDAKLICAACPVRAECLDHALRAPEKFGVWGGTTEKERRRLRKQAG